MKAASLKITTWNINSVRLRLPLIADFLKSRAPDVLCLQETKCRDAEFPMKDLHSLGYEHIAINGQKGYHGVAVISKRPLRFVEKRDFCEKGDARHICVEIDARSGPISLHNFYVPAGGDEPDVDINPKFQHKLDFLDEMRDWIVTEGVARYRAADWEASNRGRRLDHILVSEALGGGLERLDVLRDARSWTRPSDHVPVTIELSD
ncbi:MAG: endonuclease/exonuclease/phosphatase family protein [Methylocystis sp.]|nr:endonuclease/exonuclease/phosphatase family protein [Methylocystis sp.]